MSDATIKAPPSPATRGMVGMGVRSVVAAARKLRRSSTEVERILWYRIRDKQIEDFRFRRQRPIGKYIVDFVCLDAMLIIEVDGGQHADAVLADAARTRFLESLGYRVLRFWNNEVIENLEGVLERIREALLQPAKSNPPCRARCPLHRATVRQATSMLAEIPASPPTLPLAGEGAGSAWMDCGVETTPTLPLAGEGAESTNADVSARTPSPATRGKVGMGVRSNAGAANEDTKAYRK